MRFFLHLTALTFAAILSSLPAAAQQGDSAWFIKWERYIEAPDGTKDTATTLPITMWLNEEYGRLIVNDDRYITLTHDSVYIMDMYEKLYTGGLIKNRDLIHLMKVDIARHRNVAPPMLIQDTRIKKEILGYETAQLIVDLVGNSKFTPLRQLVFVTDQLPLEEALLRTWYNATAFVDSDLSIDFFTLGDSLYQRGVAPMLTKLRVNLPMNQAGWITTEMVKLERVVVPPGFFHPPPDFKRYDLIMPTEEEIWMARGMKMPGGPNVK